MPGFLGCIMVGIATKHTKIHFMVRVWGRILQRGRFSLRCGTRSNNSRGAAPECSPGREPGVGVVLDFKPRGGERVFEIFRPSGADSFNRIQPRACARGYTLTPLRGCNSDALRPTVLRSSSPTQLQTELNLPRRGGGCRDSRG